MLVEGYLVYLGDTLTSWSSKKQGVVSQSSVESKYRVLASLACKMSWLKSLLQEIDFLVVRTPKLWYDSQVQVP